MVKSHKSPPASAFLAWYAAYLADQARQAVGPSQVLIQAYTRSNYYCVASIAWLFKHGNVIDDTDACKA